MGQETPENVSRDIQEGATLPILVSTRAAYYGAPTPRFFPCPSCGALTLVGAQDERLTCALGWPHVCSHQEGA